MSEREKDIERFYHLLARLEERVGRKRTLVECHRNMGWPRRGVYFFFEDGETRSNSHGDLRVVRVGTHAVTANSKTRLWNRLYEHKQDGGRSVFRDHVNRALRKRAGNGREHNHTRCISRYIGQMPFLWVNVDGEGSHQLRRRIERNSIAMLSDFNGNATDKHSKQWLGNFSCNEAVKRSGLWNVQHTKHGYSRSFLTALRTCIKQTVALTEPGEDWDSPACLERNLG